MPVKLNIKGLAGSNADKLPCLDFSPRLNLGDHSVTHAGQRQLYKAFGRRAQMIGEGAVVATLSQEPVLQLVVRPEYNRRC